MIVGMEASGTELNPYALKQYPKGHTALKLIEVDARCNTREMRGSGKAFVDKVMLE